MNATIAVDVGATKIAAAVVVDGAAGRVMTYDDAIHDYEHSIEVIAALIGRLSPPGDPAGVGLALPGLIDAHRGLVLASPIPGWTGSRIGADLARRCGRPVTVENDGNAAAWGEYIAGSGQGCDPFIVLTLGSGVGGGIVVGGQLVRGAHGIAAELGHVLSVPGGRPCACGGRGCLEQYGSGRALMHAYARHRGAAAPADEVTAFPPPVRRELQLAFTRGLARREAAAVAALDEVGAAIGSACDRLARVLDPARISLGGGLSAVGQPLLRAVRRGVEASRTAARARASTEVGLAAHGSAAALVGMADLAARAARPEEPSPSRRAHTARCR